MPHPLIEDVDLMLEFSLQNFGRISSYNFPNPCRAQLLLPFRPHDGGYIKEAWACMSHIVLEGRRITCMTNVNNSPRVHVKPLYHPCHTLEFATFSSTRKHNASYHKLSALSITSKPTAKIRHFFHPSKFILLYRKDYVFLQIERQ